MFSINSRISDEKTMAILRTNIIADIMINAVSQTNQMEKNFWFNIFGGKTHKLLYVCWSPPEPCLNCKKSISITIIIIKFMQYNQCFYQCFFLNSYIVKEQEATIGITVSCSSRNRPLNPTSLKW